MIIPFVSHEWVNLGGKSVRELQLDRVSCGRLSSVGRFVFIWYGVGAFLLSVFMFVGGSWFLSISGYGFLEYIRPWSFLSTIYSIDFFFIGLWSFLEGCHELKSIYRFRFFQAGVFYTVFIGAVSMGCGLWSAGFAYTAKILCNIAYLFTTKYWGFFRFLLKQQTEQVNVYWRKEIFPMQWRIAISWLSGYFAFSLFTPAAFYFQGPLLASKVGITWSAMQSITAICGGYTQPFAPMMGKCVAERDETGLQRLFGTLWKNLFFIALAVSSAFLITLLLLDLFNNPFGERFVSLPAAICFTCGQVLQIMSIPFSIYLRSHKTEPLVLISVLQGALIAIYLFFLGSRISGLVMGGGYMMVNSIIILLVITMWHYCRRKWHYKYFS